LNTNEIQQNRVELQNTIQYLQNIPTEISNRLTLCIDIHNYAIQNNRRNSSSFDYYYINFVVSEFCGDIFASHHENVIRQLRIIGPILKKCRRIQRFDK